MSSFTLQAFRGQDSLAEGIFMLKCPTGMPNAEILEHESEELRIAIGQQIKRLRKSQNLKLDEAAERTGLSRSTLSQIENGNTSPSVAQLLKISRLFDVDIAQFFQKQDIVDELEINRKNQRKRIYPRHADPEYDGYVHEYTGAFVAQGTVETFEVVVLPGAEEEMQFNTHAGMERIFVVDGPAELVIKRSEEDRKVYRTELYPGDVLSFPAKYPHAYRALGDQGIRMYVELFCKPGQSLSESSGATLVSVDSSAEN